MRSLLLGLAALASAKDIEVNWIIKPVNKPMQHMMASPGDTLIFKWGGRHNVWILPDCDGEGDHQWDEFKCPAFGGDWGKEIGDSSPTRYTVPVDAKAGDYICFVCEIPGHCNAGQHTTLMIVDKPKVIDIDWVIPRNKVDQNLQLVHASPGDELKFSWGGFHNVYLLDECSGKWDEFTCPTSQAQWNKGKNLGAKSAVSFLVPKDMKEGDSLCFACQVGPHCALGQYTTVVIKKEDGGGQACCKALIASCQACVANQTVEEFCAEKEGNYQGCPDGEDSGDGKACCRAQTARCLACAADQTVDEFCKAQEKEIQGCPAKGGEEPFESLDELVAFCANADEESCKLCGGRFKRNKCSAKLKKLKKIKCKKIKDLAFCVRVGCKVSKKKNACSGKPTLK